MTNSNFNTPESQTVIEREVHDKEHPYLIVSKSLIRDKEISIRSRGVLIYLLSFPDNWKFHHKKIAKDIGIGRDQFYNSLHEIITCGYGTYEVFRNEKGHIIKHLYRFSERKRTFVKKEPFPEIQDVDISEEEDSHSDFQPLPEKPDLDFEDYTNNDYVGVKNDKTNNEGDSSIADSLLSDEKKETKKTIMEMCKSKDLRIKEKTISIWLTKYDSLEILQNFDIMLRQKTPIGNHEAWMESALKRNYAEIRTIEEGNKKWFKAILDKVGCPPFLDITTHYFRDNNLGKEFLFSLPDFQNMVKNQYPNLMQIYEKMS